MDTGYSLGRSYQFSLAHSYYSYFPSIVQCINLWMFQIGNKHFFDNSVWKIRLELIKLPNFSSTCKKNSRIYGCMNTANLIYFFLLFLLDFSLIETKEKHKISKHKTERHKQKISPQVERCCSVEINSLNR